MSDAASSGYARVVNPPSSRHHGSPQSRGDQHRLFDPRRDNPHKFGAHTRPAQPAPSSGSPNLNGRPTPTPKSSGDYISASSTSSASYAQSTISSSFTFSSNTTDSSASSAIFDSQRRSEESAGPVNALSVKLKRLYRTISSLEDKVAKGNEAPEDEPDRDGHRMGVLQRADGGQGQEVKGGDEDAEREKWKKLITDHKEYVTYHLDLGPPLTTVLQACRPYAPYVDADRCTYCALVVAERSYQIQPDNSVVDAWIPPALGELASCLSSAYKIPCSSRTSSSEL